jgi:cytochrome oxidase assembly protein ShyY1
MAARTFAPISVMTEAAFAMNVAAGQWQLRRLWR